MSSEALKLLLSEFVSAVNQDTAALRSQLVPFLATTEWTLAQCPGPDMDPQGPLCLTVRLPPVQNDAQHSKYWVGIMENRFPTVTVYDEAHFPLATIQTVCSCLQDSCWHILTQVNWSST